MSDILPFDRPEFADRVAANQRRLTADLHGSYDFIVCGAGSSGSVVARRLAENPSVRVLLIEAGGSDDMPTVMDPMAWAANLGSANDWGYVTEPNPHLNGRALPLNAGKVVGGGSSINVMVWARGHRSDWDHFAKETGDESWGYDSVLGIYRDIEDWQGRPDPRRRGTGGPLYVQPVPDPGPAAVAMVDAAREIGIPTFASANGEMMEGDGGCAFEDVLIRNGRRNSIFRAFTYPVLDQPNITLLTGTQVTRVIVERGKAVGVEAVREGRRLRFAADREVVLSLGAIQTPALLMRSGIGDEGELRQHEIPAILPLPGVGANLQDHVAFCCIWEYREPIAPRNTGSAATLYWKTDPSLPSPDLLFCQVEFPVPSPETALRGVPAHGWTMFAGLAQPKSRGRVRLRSADPLAAPRIEHSALSDPEDVRAAIAAVDLCRRLGSTRAFDPLVVRESLPGELGPAEMEQFVRDAAVTYWHPTGTARMGRDEMSVVDGKLRVYGIDRLRIADGSVMPRIATGNTMAPCVVIGEKAARAIRAEHGF
ncbi:GMC family oxidoreductase [Arenibaculum pallidiluteum]|uniref:GMC family oxidoreductase n=1 Tax=Arenibaculum pallidiluteum TaxID=2812559 RepID=UPI001A95F42E|nr:GMC family oxidoreductase N-terminal domain-containing protein [Arenibaculum pallidiluteum]